MGWFLSRCKSLQRKRLHSRRQLAGRLFITAKNGKLSGLKSRRFKAPTIGIPAL
jgi:hypothetical protein